MSFNQQGRRTSGTGMSFIKLIVKFIIRGLQAESNRESVKQNRLEIKHYLSPVLAPSTHR